MRGSMKVKQPPNRLRHLPPPKTMGMKTYLQRQYHPVTLLDHMVAKVTKVLSVLSPWPYMAVSFVFHLLQDAFIYIPGFAFVILDCILLISLLGVSLVLRFCLYLAMLPRTLFMFLFQQYFSSPAKGAGPRGGDARSKRPMKFDRASVKKSSRTSLAQLYAFVRNRVASREQLLASLSSAARMVYVALLTVHNKLQQHVERGLEKNTPERSHSTTILSFQGASSSHTMSMSSASESNDEFENSG